MTIKTTTNEKEKILATENLNLINYFVLKEDNKTSTKRQKQQQK